MKPTQCATPCRISNPCDSDPFFLFTPSHQTTVRHAHDKIARYHPAPSESSALEEKALNYPADIIFETPVSDLLSGETFQERVSTFIHSVDRFGVLMIRPDGLKPVFRPENSPDFHSILQEASVGYSPVWGLVDPATFCGLFPELNEPGCHNMIQLIRQNLKQAMNLTVAMGAAVFPMHSFSRDDTLLHALKALNHALLLGADKNQFLDALSLNISGDCLYQQGDISGAIQEFEKALILDPGNVNVLNSLGVCFGVQKAYDNALKQFDMALAHDHHEVMAIYNKGVIHVLAGNMMEALACFTAAEPLGRDIFEVMFQAGKLHLTLGDLKNAQQCLERAVQLRPDAGQAIRFLGQSLMELGINREAIAVYSRAVRKNPFDAESLSTLGHLYDLAGEDSEIALVFCSKSVEISPQNGLYRYRLGRIHLGQNKLDEALKEFRLASQLGYDASAWIQQIVDIRSERRTV
ncbi:MAG: tetratricopeptide repeat protein [Desulfatirhabdiaceae bacterium]